mmetsp:Transcript_74/g.98  ORF Transcript_74/g.98 Transcript_74/m.98 type:complete len:390 (+) Transcript_74:71-1240(+)|eukprot:CAMPEP_0204908832 /NCGR_PEP_ID=MMETSP1397-20131031/7703_1 /ASSEMBLY_ACC=CAM_ASM_000891 /TAXON_ID=49980 /ORGANISM="Climacostomum Climacostomum virens, Strain Stock W-24" /LENGTH=389 /DNA_ID=CAMNT_0052078495 /DNA_START=44 /DNA_END=1213 /DNA_ORIENTATION=+
MSKQEIGLTALLAGSSATSEAFGVLPTHVEACIQEIRYEISPTLKAFRDVIKRKAQETDLAHTSELFKLPLSALQVIVGELPSKPVEVEKPKPQAAKKVEAPPKSPMKAAKKVAEAPKKSATVHKKAEEPAVVPQTIEHQRQQAEEKKVPKVAVKEKPARATVPAAQSVPESESVVRLRQKISNLYKNGVKATVISALYKIPTPLVHTWGDWSQLPPTKADENRSLSNSAKDLIHSGVQEKEVMEALGLKNPKTYSYLLGRFDIPKSFSSEHKAASVDYTKLVRNIKKAAEELDIPHKRLRSWVNKEDLSSDEDFLSCGKGTKKDEERLKALEEYYLNNKSVSAAAKKTGIPDMYKIINWVTEFEKTCLSTPKKRQKTSDAPETLEVED